MKNFQILIFAIILAISAPSFQSCTMNDVDIEEINIYEFDETRFRKLLDEYDARLDAWKAEVRGMFLDAQYDRDKLAQAVSQSSLKMDSTPTLSFLQTLEAKGLGTYYCNGKKYRIMQTTLEIQKFFHMINVCR